MDHMDHSGSVFPVDHNFRVSAEAPSADAAAKPTPNPEKIIRQTQHAEDKADRVKSPKLLTRGLCLK